MILRLSYHLEFLLLLTLYYCNVFVATESAPYLDTEQHLSTVDRTGSSVSFTLKSGDHKELDAGVFQLVHVSGEVWEDEYADGLRQEGERGNGVGGVAVELHASAGGDASMVSTDGDGHFQFMNVDVGEYSVHFKVPPGYFVSDAPPAETAAAYDVYSQADRDGRTPMFTLRSHGRTADGKRRVEAVRVDCGLWRQARFVVPLRSVRCAHDGVLFRLRRMDGSYEHTMRVSDANGGDELVFDALRPGQYAVEVQLPKACMLAPTPCAVNATNVRLDVQRSATDAFGVRSGAERRLCLNLVERAHVSAELYRDNNGDGVRQSGEQAYKRATTATLRFVAPLDEQTDVAELPEQQCDTSVKTGRCTFEPTLPGVYEVEFTLYDCESCTMTRQFCALTRTDESGAAELEVRDDWRRALPGADADPLRVGCTGLGGVERHLVVSQGLFSPSSVHGTVWEDMSNDGIWERDVETRGVPHLTVRLVSAVTNAAVQTTKTNNRGHYAFTDFDFGDYFVRFERPADFLFSVQHTGALKHPTRNAANANGVSEVFTCLSDTEYEVNAGVYRSASIDAAVWLDRDANARRLSDDLPLHGVKVRLLKAHDTSFSQSSVSGKDGHAFFPDLEPDDYYVRFELSAKERDDGFRFSTNKLNYGGLKFELRRTEAGGSTAGADEGFGALPDARELRALVARVGGAAIVEEWGGADAYDVINVHAGDSDDLLIFDVVLTVRPELVRELVEKFRALSESPDWRPYRCRSVSRWILTPERTSSNMDVRQAAPPFTTRLNFANEEGETPVIRLRSGEHKGVGGGVHQLARVGGYVFDDANGNGVWDRASACTATEAASRDCDSADALVEAEEAAAHVSVELRTNESGAPRVVREQLSDENGRFDFRDVEPGEYYVHFALCANCKFSPKVADFIVE